MLIQRSKLSSLVKVALILLSIDEAPSILVFWCHLNPSSVMYDPIFLFSRFFLLQNLFTTSFSGAIESDYSPSKDSLRLVRKQSRSGLFLSLDTSALDKASTNTAILGAILWSSRVTKHQQWLCVVSVSEGKCQIYSLGEPFLRKLGVKTY